MIGYLISIIAPNEKNLVSKTPYWSPVNITDAENLSTQNLAGKKAFAKLPKYNRLRDINQDYQVRFTHAVMLYFRRPHAF